MSITLHIRLLGEFRLAYDNRPLEAILPPRAQSLLAYLLINRTAPQPRQRLAFLFWPDSSEAQARTNLRKQVHQLRHALPDADSFLADDAATLQWRLDAPYMLDIAGFEQALDNANQATQAGDQAIVRSSLEQALSLYQGTLLPDCFDDWVLPERQRLHQLYITAAEQLILLLERAEEYRQAISHAQRLVQYDPLHEEGYRQLMRLHALSGDRTGAVRVYRTCAAVLERDLGVEPSSATREAYARLVEVVASPSASSQAPTAVERRHNLPLQLTSFVGREREVAEVERLLAGTRLLTLTGIGGSGKTRLAIEVATRLEELYADGICWVELASLAEAGLVVQSVAVALGLAEQPGQTHAEAVAGYLRTKRLLLVLDNCEHLVEECAAVAAGLLQTCSHLKILATSREGLGIAGETIWLVPGLALPQRRGPGIEDPGHSEAVRLFVERAAVAMPTFRLTDHNAAAVVQICRRLDGIPLAIELAAVRVRMLAVDQIATRLDDALRLLKGSSRTALARHQTLQAVIDRSYDLLSEPERALLRRLAVFAGGFTLAAAEAICQDERVPAEDVLDLLSYLIDKSLVMVGGGDEALSGYAEARYQLLETVRQYGMYQLHEAGEAEILQRQHAHFFLAFAEQAEPQLTGPQETIWLSRLETEHDNLRATFAWALDQGQAETAARLGGALWRFWEGRGYLSEGRRWVEAALARGDTLVPQVRARALIAAGNLAWDQCDYPAARAFLGESLALRRASGDIKGIAEALSNLGGVAQEQGDYTTASAFLVESLALRRELGDRWGSAVSLNNLGNVAYSEGDYATAYARFSESLVLGRELGQKRFISTSLNNLGNVALSLEDYDTARVCHEESLAISRQVGDKQGMASSLNNLGVVARRQGDVNTAYSLFARALNICQEIGDKRGITDVLEEFAVIASVRQEAERAVRLASAAAMLRETLGLPLDATGQVRLDRWIEPARQALNLETRARASAQGRVMSLEQTIADVLAQGSQPALIADMQPGSSSVYMPPERF